MVNRGRYSFPERENFDRRYEDQEIYFSDELRLAIKKWGYDHDRAFECPGNCKDSTDKQREYISRLAEKNPSAAWELELIINTATSDSSYSSIECCYRGQAHFVIQCLTGVIHPIDVTHHADAGQSTLEEGER